MLEWDALVGAVASLLSAVAVSVAGDSFSFVFDTWAGGASSIVSDIIFREF